MITGFTNVASFVLKDVEEKLCKEHRTLRFIIFCTASIDFAVGRLFPVPCNELGKLTTRVSFPTLCHEKFFSLAQPEK